MAHHFRPRGFAEALYRHSLKHRASEGLLAQYVLSLRPITDEATRETLERSARWAEGQLEYRRMNGDWDFVYSAERSFQANLHYLREALESGKTFREPWCSDGGSYILEVQETQEGVWVRLYPRQAR